ncbi:hypothetical protein GUITHDRAFT_155474 [Guillardia theta CCMP2712]|uniref:Uncharacterized protein n=1 Tax=Guillardia theta (strain CCMP2712) TaxID=905079 RepID=L1IGX9_GUITC|nr:hypothetical protein GUITHDRAFT_155474 [Guillardia theta CCMP2712]EKX35516.1 hypothetical protein GUITHDRAFT_155474 [Guillardia theta CCMP2712]|eukprot:XP_005822496.1 hypothetical protein GUITHDRAFT_155474 [Guillardia theta CCMP2712]
MGAAGSKTGGGKGGGGGGGEDHLSAAWKLGMAGGYGALIAVNAMAMNGTMGPTNAKISGLWPTSITPAGYAFSIWGIIFLLQGGGVILSLISSSDRSNVNQKNAAAVCKPWLMMWAAQNLWQLVFVHAPLSQNAPASSQLAIFVPCSFFLCAAYASGLEACRRLRKVESNVASTLFLRLPSAINAGWLSAASCIGIALVGQSMAGGKEELGAGLPVTLAGMASVGAIASFYSWGAGEGRGGESEMGRLSVESTRRGGVAMVYVAVVTIHFPGSLLTVVSGSLSLGYAGAVSWALAAILRGSNASPSVRTAASVGIGAIGMAAGAAILLAVLRKGRGEGEGKAKPLAAQSM